MALFDHRIDEEEGQGGAKGPVVRLFELAFDHVGDHLAVGPAHQVRREIKKANDWPFGAALSFILIYAMFILIALQSMRRKVPEAR